MVVEQVTVEQVAVEQLTVVSVVVAQAGSPQNVVPQPPQSWKVVPQLVVEQLVPQTCTAHETTLPPLSMTSGLHAVAETTSADTRTASKLLSMTTPPITRRASASHPGFRGRAEANPGVAIAARRARPGKLAQPQLLR